MDRQLFLRARTFYLYFIQRIDKMHFINESGNSSNGDLDPDIVDLNIST